MVTYKEALAARLLAVATGMVGSRVYLRSPKIVGTFPQITYFIVSDTSSIETLPNQILFQLDIWGLSDAILEQICDVLRAGLHDQPFAVVGAYHPFLREIDRKDAYPEPDGEKVLQKIMVFRSILYLD